MIWGWFVLLMGVGISVFGVVFCCNENLYEEVDGFCFCFLYFRYGEIFESILFKLYIEFYFWFMGYVSVWV